MKIELQLKEKEKRPTTPVDDLLDHRRHAYLIINGDKEMVDDVCQLIESSDKWDII